VASSDEGATVVALPPILVELKANAGSFVAGMKEAQHEVQKLGTQSAGHMQKFAAVGKAALFGVGAAAVGVSVVSLKMGMDFQAAMELIHTQAGASQVEVNKMSKAVLGLAGKTATAPEELAAGLYHLESSGLRGAKALEALKIAAEGAKVGHANLEDVTNALNAVIASGIPGAHDMTKAMGMLNATVGAGDMRMQDLADAMGTGLLAGVKGFGLNLKDVGAALAVFGDNNIRGADAATQLRLAVQFMAKPAKGAADTFKQLGMNTGTLAKDMREGGLNKAITDLHDRLDKAGIKGNQVGQILLDAFGKKAGVGIGVLLEQYSRFKSKIDEVHSGASRFGEDWNATQKTMAFQTQKLIAQAEALGTKIGLALIPVLQKAATVTMNVVNWFEKHTTEAKILGIAIGSVLVTAIGAYVVAATQAAIATVAATWPILAIIAAIAALGVGIYELATHWHTVWNDIKNVVSVAANFIKDHANIIAVSLALLLGPIGLLIGAALELGLHWRAVWNGIKTVTAVAWRVLHPIFELIWNVGLLPVRVAVLLLEAAFKVAWDGVVLAVRAAWVVLKPIFTVLVHAGLWLIKTEVNALRDVWDVAWGGVVTTLQHVWSVIKPILDTMKRAVDDTIGSLGKVAGFASKVGGGVIGGLSHLLPHFAAGTDYAPGGWAVAGELGPELVNLPRGSKVYPTGTGPASGGDVVVNINGPVYGANSRELAKNLRDALLDYRRSSGQSLGFT
jgi:TP901 family phage tail tape measure protein